MGSPVELTNFQFYGMIAHGGCPIGATWHDPLCARCSLLMRAPVSLFVGYAPPSICCGVRVYLILSKVGVQQGYYTWGAVFGLQLYPRSHLFFFGEDVDLVFMLSSSGYFRGSHDMVEPIARQDDLREVMWFLPIL